MKDDEFSPPKVPEPLRIPAMTPEDAAALERAFRHASRGPVQIIPAEPEIPMVHFGVGAQTHFIPASAVGLVVVRVPDDTSGDTLHDLAQHLYGVRENLPGVKFAIISDSIELNLLTDEELAFAGLQRIKKEDHS